MFVVGAYTNKINDLTSNYYCILENYSLILLNSDMLPQKGTFLSSFLFYITNILIKILILAIYIITYLGRYPIEVVKVCT